MRRARSRPELIRDTVGQGVGPALLPGRDEGDLASVVGRSGYAEQARRGFGITGAPGEVGEFVRQSDGLAGRAGRECVDCAAPAHGRRAVVTGDRVRSERDRPCPRFVRVAARLGDELECFARTRERGSGVLRIDIEICEPDLNVDRCAPITYVAAQRPGDCPVDTCGSVVAKMAMAVPQVRERVRDLERRSV